MNLEEFRKEFKVYCETVEDTVALDVIKDEIFKDNLDIQDLIYIYISPNECDNKKMIKKAKMLKRSIDFRIELAEKIENCEWREIYKLLDNLLIYEIERIFESAMGDLSEAVHDKYNVNPFKGEELTKEQLEKEKWFIDLCDLVDKYNIC